MVGVTFYTLLVVHTIVIGTFYMLLAFITISIACLYLLGVHGPHWAGASAKVSKPCAQWVIQNH